MIIRFTLENWMSFRNKVTFSMIASRERQHGNRVPKLRKYQTRILPITAIYGGNASGKTNFCKALRFAQRLVVDGLKPDSLIPVKPFLLDDEKDNEPSRFHFELLIDDIIYEFSFAVTRQKILEEKLVRITSTSEKVLYNRRGSEIKINPSLAKDEFLNFAFQGTRDNQLFLTNSVSQKVNNFQPVHDWFKDTLKLVAPDSRFAHLSYFLDEKYPFYSSMDDILQQLDTGIEHLGGEKIPFEDIPISERMKDQIQENIKEEMTFRLDRKPNNSFIITRKGGVLIAKKLVTYHLNTDGTKIKFEIDQESDGTQRVINLLPAFLDLSPKSSKRVYVIDEIDRSLHTHITRALLEAYLANCSTETRSQLLLTTHDLQLMDQQLLRRDEIWVTERDADGATHLIPFSDFKDIRYDKDIRKSYLEGRLGGIPQIVLGGALTNPILTEESEDDE